VEEETEQRKYWSKEEIIQFLSIAEQQSELRDFVAFRLFLFSGMRRGELCALTDEDINFEQRTIKVNKTFAWKKDHTVKIEPPKTKNSIREISIDQTTLELIKKLSTMNKKLDLQIGARSSRSRLIFYRYKDSEKAPLAPIHFNTRLNALCKKHHLHRISVHQMRHSHASMLIEAGANVKDVQERLGHADIKTTLNIYTHVTDTQREKTADLFAHYMENEN
jgi:integrase